MVTEKEFEIIIRIVPSKDNITLHDIISKRDQIKSNGYVDYGDKRYSVIDMWIKEENPDLYKIIVQVDDINA